MNRRALIVSAVIAALGAVLLYLYLERFEDEVSGGGRIQVLVLNETLDRGELISDDVLAVTSIPVVYVEDRSVKAMEREKVTGLRVGNRVAAQQTLLWTDLEIATDERRELSSLIQPGNRAVFIRAESGDKTTQLIRPGDYVDVIANLPSDDGAKRKAIVLLQKVLVLSVGGETTTQQSLGSPKKANVWGMGDNVITLSVNLQEAQLLTLAKEKGTLEVALRNPDDQQVAEGLPDLSSSALTDSGVRRMVSSKPSGPVRLEKAEE